MHVIENKKSDQNCVWISVLEPNEIWQRWMLFLYRTQSREHHHHHCHGSMLIFINISRLIILYFAFAIVSISVVIEHDVFLLFLSFAIAIDEFSSVYRCCHCYLLDLEKKNFINNRIQLKSVLIYFAADAAEVIIFFFFFTCLPSIHDAMHNCECATLSAISILVPIEIERR